MKWGYGTWDSQILSKCVPQIKKWLPWPPMLMLTFLPRMYERPLISLFIFSIYILLHSSYSLLFLFFRYRPFEMCIFSLDIKSNCSTVVVHINLKVKELSCFMNIDLLLFHMFHIYMCLYLIYANMFYYIYNRGSVNQVIGVHHASGSSVNVIKYHEGFMGQRIAPVSCLAFHPRRVLLAAGTTDSYITVYGLSRR